MKTRVLQSMALTSGLILALVAGLATAASPATGDGNTEGNALADAEVAVATSTSPRPSSRLDRTHDWLYLRMQRWAGALDHKFVREGEVEEPVPPSPFRLGLESEYIDRDDGADINGRIDLDLILQLPNLEKRLKIFVTSDSVEESPSRLSERERNVRAGFRLRSNDFLDFDVGLRADVPPVAFTSVRWQRQYGAGGWDIEPFTKVYLETKDGFGVAGGVTFDRWMNRFLVRSSTYANWRHDKDETRWTQSVMFAHAREILRFGRYGAIVRGSDLVRAIGIQALASGEGERASGVDTYEVNVFAKMPTSRNWLYWYVTPMVRFERKYDWNADPGIRAGVDILFWDLSDR